MSKTLYCSKSAFEAFLRCPMLWWFGYVLGARTIGGGSEAAITGNVLHKGILEGFFLKGGTYQVMCTEMESHEDWPELDHDRQALCYIILKAAEQAFDRMRDEIEVISVEDKVYREVQLHDITVRHTIVLDMLYRDAEGKLNVFDLKTTKMYLGSPGKKPWYWEKARRDLQVPYYLTEAEKHTGERIHNVDWQVVRIPLGKQERFGENPRNTTYEEHADWLANKMGSNTSTWFPFSP